MRRRDLLALGGSLVVTGLVVLVVLRIRAAGGTADGNTIASQWEGYISVVATALLPLSWLAAWWSGSRSPNAPAGPATSAGPPQPPPGSPPGPPGRRPAGRRWLIAVALAVLVGGSVTALALRPSGSRGSQVQAAEPPPTATPTSPTPRPSQVTTSGPTSTSPEPDLIPSDRPHTTSSTTKPPPPSSPPPPPSSEPPPPPPQLTLDSPTAGTTLQSRTTVSGTASRLGSGDTIWLFLYSADVGNYYIVSRDGVIRPAADGSWQGPIGADPDWPGDYRLYAVIVDAADGKALAVQAGESVSPYLKALPRSVGSRQVHIDVQCCS